MILASRTHQGNATFYHDDDHLSVYGANVLVAELMRAMDEKWPRTDAPAARR